MGKNIFANNMTDKDLISKLNKHSNNSIAEHTTQLKNE